MKNNFRIFKYFINGVVSTLKSYQQERKLKHARRLQLEQERTQKVVYLKAWKRSSQFRAKVQQKLNVNKQVREEQQMKKSVFARKLQIGVKHFWKGKQDYVHTG